MLSPSLSSPLWTSITYFYFRLILECASLRAHIPVHVPALPLALFPLLSLSFVFSPHIVYQAPCLHGNPPGTGGALMIPPAFHGTLSFLFFFFFFLPPHSFSRPIYLFIPPRLTLSTSVRQSAYGFCGLVRARPHMFPCSLPAGCRWLCEGSAARIRLCSFAAKSSWFLGWERGGCSLEATEMRRNWKNCRGSWLWKSLKNVSLGASGSGSCRAKAIFHSRCRSLQVT